MRKYLILVVAGLLVVLGACNKEEEYDNELTENEKISLNLDREQSHYEEVFELIEELEPEDSNSFDNGRTISFYEPEEFIRFILPEGWVNEVTVTSKETDEGTEIESIGLIYTYRDHNIIVDYFSDESIHKAILDYETGYVIINENDEKYSKF